MTEEEKRELAHLLEDIEELEKELFTLRSLAAYYQQDKNKGN